MSIDWLQYPIFITGCARSGTSMTAGVVNICGAWGGNTSPANIYNRKGMFENAEIRDKITKPFLVSIGADPLCQNPLPDISIVYKEANKMSLRWKDTILKTIQKQGYDGTVQWFYKGAKMCLIWWLWHLAFPDARWIIVRRNRKDIVNSCLKTGFMSAYTTEDDWYKWIDEHEKRFDEMKKEGLKIMEVTPQRMVNGDFVEIKTVIACLGLDWNEEKVFDFITPALWSGKDTKCLE